MSQIKEFILSVKNLASPLSTFFAGTLLVGCATGLLGSFLAICMLANGVSTSEIGLVLSLHYLGYIIASFSAYKTINRVGHIRAFSAYVSILSALVLLHAFSPSPIFWGALRLMEGYCVGAAWTCLESWLNTRSNNKNRGIIMSFYMIISYIGVAIGQLLLNMPNYGGFGMFVIISVILSVGLVPISLTALPSPNITAYKSMSLFKLYKTAPVGVVGCIASGCLVGTFYSLGAVYGKEIGLSIKDISLFMFFGVLGGMLIQMPIGRLSDKMDRRYVLLWCSSFLFFIAPWLHIFIKDGAWSLALAATLLGFGTFIIYPICVSHVNDKIEDGERAHAAGLLILLQSLGLMFGPVIASFFMEHLGNICFIGTYSVVSAAFALFTLKQIISKEKVNYVEVTPTVPQPFAPTHVYTEISNNSDKLTLHEFFRRLRDR